jgi:hypothetical protein
MGQVTTVTIGAVVYSIYGEVAADALTPQISADEWFNADVQWAATWAALTADQKARALVTATRALDQLFWEGTKVSPSQPLGWPRDGADYHDGTTVPGGTFVPDEVVQATYILGMMLHNKPSLLSQSTATAANIAEVGAGTARVKFFRPLLVSILPLEISALLSQFLGSTSSSTTGPAYVTGVSDESAFDTTDAFSVGMP